MCLNNKGGGQSDHLCDTKATVKSIFSMESATSSKKGNDLKLNVNGLIII